MQIHKAYGLAFVMFDTMYPLVTALLLCSYLRLTCQVCHLMWENNTCIVSLLIRGATEWIGTTQPKHIQPLDGLRDHFLFLDWTWVKFFYLN